MENHEWCPRDLLNGPLQSAGLITGIPRESEPKITTPNEFFYASYWRFVGESNQRPYLQLNFYSTVDPNAERE